MASRVAAGPGDWTFFRCRAQLSSTLRLEFRTSSQQGRGIPNVSIATEARIPSDQENIAKHRLIARPGWCPDGSTRKTTPAASASEASRHFIDDAATPPCGDARRGLSLPKLTANVQTPGRYAADHTSPLPRARSLKCNARRVCVVVLARGKRVRCSHL